MDEPRAFPSPAPGAVNYRPDDTPGLPLFDSTSTRGRAYVASAVAVVAIALVDWKVTPNLTLGFLYIFPILVLALFVRRGPIAAVAAACGVLRELLSPFAWDGDAAARIFMGVIAFAGAGLFVSELARNRRLAIQHTEELRRQIELREELKEELRVLVESSPAAIFTLDWEGRVLLANEAAGRLLGFEGSFLGEPMKPWLPALVSALERPRTLVRTNMECVGRRRDGEVFLAHAWFSTYRTSAGARLAAIVFDASEQLRDREALGLGSVAAASRVLFGAVSHEVRNLAAAAAVAYANLGRTSGLAKSDDFEALGVLVDGLQRIASSDLRLGANAAVASIDLQDVLDQLRIVLEPALREDGVRVEWRIPSALPRVLADPHSLLQIFLNLAQNSQREMAGARERVLTVAASEAPECVVLRFEDTGPGVKFPERLFQPFGRGGEASGLGLFVSRTIARSFAGDLRHEPRATGSCFAVHLARSNVSMTA